MSKSKDKNEEKLQEQNESLEESDFLDKEELAELEQELVSTNPELFEGIAIEKKEELLRTISITHQSSVHSGPIPHPDTLAKYEQIVPHAGDRIISMAEKQSNHRMQLEKTVINRQSFQSILGQIFGFIIGMTGLGLGAYITISGYPYVGATICGGTVVSLVWAFVQGRKMQNKDSTFSE